MINCPKCPREFTERGLANHMRSCSGSASMTYEDMVKEIYSLKRVSDTQERYIQSLSKRVKELEQTKGEQLEIPTELPILTEEDMLLYLTKDLSAVVNKYDWPVRPASNCKLEKYEEGKWCIMNDDKIGDLMFSIEVQLKQLWNVYYKKYNLVVDPNSMCGPEYSSKIYGLKVSVVKEAFLLKV